MTICSNCKKEIKGRIAYKDRKALCSKCFESKRKVPKVREDHFGWFK